MTAVKETETRVTSATGGEKGQKLPRLGGADPLALLELARVYGFGEGKYARWNYLKGYDWSLSIDALYRHFLAFQAGEDLDPESGLHHMAHVAWHSLALVAFEFRGVGTDDRFRVSDMEKIKTTLANIAAPERGLYVKPEYIQQALGFLRVHPGGHLPSDWLENDPSD